MTLPDRLFRLAVIVVGVYYDYFINRCYGCCAEVTCAVTLSDGLQQPLLTGAGYGYMIALPLCMPASIVHQAYPTSKKAMCGLVMNNGDGASE